jgi:hypothetical protein
VSTFLGVKPALALTLGVLVLALPAQAAHEADSATQTIRLVSMTVGIHTVVDRAPKGVPNKGDAVREESVLSNDVRQFGRPKGAPVGSDVATYTIVSTRPMRMRLKLTVKLPGGTLRGTAQVAGSGFPTIRIVGGTRNFAGARGTGVVRPRAGGRAALNVYRLRLP